MSSVRKLSQRVRCQGFGRSGRDNIAAAAVSLQIGDGLKAIQIREHRELATTCFFLIRSDGSVDDVSYRK